MDLAKCQAYDLIEPEVNVVNHAPSNVVRLHPCDSSAALESLNRITGLTFSRWPESLVSAAKEKPVRHAPPACDPSGAPVCRDQAFA